MSELHLVGKVLRAKRTLHYSWDYCDVLRETCLFSFILFLSVAVSPTYHLLCSAIVLVVLYAGKEPDSGSGRKKSGSSSKKAATAAKGKGPEEQSCGSGSATESNRSSSMMPLNFVPEEVMSKTTMGAGVLSDFVRGTKIVVCLCVLFSVCWVFLFFFIVVVFLCFDPIRFSCTRIASNFVMMSTIYRG